MNERINMFSKILSIPEWLMWFAWSIMIEGRNILALVWLFGPVFIFIFSQNRCVETLMLHAWWRSTCVSLEATRSQHPVFTLLSMKSSTVMGKTVWSLISAISDATTYTLQSTSTLGRRFWSYAFNCVIVMRSTPRCCQMSTFSTIKTIRGRLLLRLLSTSHGPLTRLVKLWVAHAPGMPGTFSPAADFKGNRKLAIPICLTAHVSRTCREACRDRLPTVAGKTFSAFTAHAHPQMYVSGKKPISSWDRPLSVGDNGWGRHWWHRQEPSFAQHSKPDQMGNRRIQRYGTDLVSDRRTGNEKLNF